MSNKKLVASKHAYKRAKQRLGWKRKTLKRMLVKVYRCGYQICETNGELHRFLREKMVYSNPYTHVRIYGEFVYFFNQKVLLTMYRLNNCFLKHLNYMRS